MMPMNSNEAWGYIQSRLPYRRRAEVSAAMCHEPAGPPAFLRWRPGAVFRLCLLFVLAFALVHEAGACADGGNPNQCAGGDPAAASSPATPSGVKNPIHVVTGNKYQREVDHAPYGVSVRLAPVLIRHYNSHNTTTVTGFGVGWTTTYDALLGVINRAERQIVQSDGRRMVFRRRGNSARFDAVRPTDGYVEQHGEGHTWVLPDGRRLRFNHRGRLERISAPDGSVLHVVYDQDGRLSLVRDGRGRTLKFQWYGQSRLARFGTDGFEAHEIAGRIAAVTLPDGSVVRYHYTGDGDVSQVTWPDGRRRRYHYEDDRHPHALTGITDETGRRYATWGYDEQGRAIYTQKAGGAERVNLEYHVPADWSERGRTVVTDSLGRTTVYTWRRYIHEGISLLLSAEGPGCNDCPAGNRRYEYNDRFQLIAVHYPGGITERREYDGRGRLVRVVREAADGTTETAVRYEYRGESWRPVAVVRPSVNPAGEHRVELEYTASGRPRVISEGNS